MSKEKEQKEQGAGSLGSRLKLSRLATAPTRVSALSPCWPARLVGGTGAEYSAASMFNANEKQATAARYTL